ncbi:MAG: PTS sugar transporter subunit IIB [Lachnospiraceae bacterium]|nr:PTS sugar transporter subunit IIB [Lachnospiraceae bacterium]
MVVLCRVDERLLHGQVAVTWVSQVQPDSILIADDEVMKNEMSRMALKMVKPTGVNMAIRSVEDGAGVLNDPRAEKLRIFVVVRTLRDAVRLCEMTDTITKINVGGIKKKEGARLVAASVYLNDEDLANLQRLVDLGKEVEFRMVPSESGKKAEQILSEYK